MTQFRWPYGKLYKGLALDQIPGTYLRWALDRAKKAPLTTGFTPQMCKLIRLELKRRKE